MVDLAIKNHQSSPLLQNFRVILFSSTLGTALGIFFMPTFVNIFGRLILGFEREGSILRLIFKLFRPRTFSVTVDSFLPPKKDMLKSNIFKNIPKKFFFLQLLITGFYTIGVLSSLFDRAIMPQYRVTASQLSGIINGMAAILLMIFVDPSVAIITDQVLRAVRPQEDIRNVVVVLAFARILGTILAQVLIVPCAYLVAFVATKM